MKPAKYIYKPGFPIHFSARGGMVPPLGGGAQVGYFKTDIRLKDIL